VIRLKRAYKPAARADGRRVLVERLWPRGVTKDALHADAWIKDAAPSAALRTWFGHEPARWPEFRRRYTAELRAHPEAWAELRAWSRRGTVTLLYAARDTEHNSALVLRDLLTSRSRRSERSIPAADHPGGTRRSRGTGGTPRRRRARGRTSR